MTYRALIPNMLTSSNLVFGVCSIFSTMKGDLFWGSLFILIALVADGLDGRAGVEQGAACAAVIGEGIGFDFFTGGNGTERTDSNRHNDASYILVC